MRVVVRAFTVLAVLNLAFLFGELALNVLGQLLPALGLF
jgi:hypothetical protein